MSSRKPSHASPQPQQDACRCLRGSRRPLRRDHRVACAGFQGALRRLGGAGYCCHRKCARYGEIHPSTRTSSQPDRRCKLQGMNDRPVFKERLALPANGKRRGARIIVYCDDDVVIPLSIYAKSERGIVPEGIINDELVAIGPRGTTDSNCHACLIHRSSGTGKGTPRQASTSVAPTQPPGTHDVPGQRP